MATVNNNWPTPVQTDLVKDGWEAIKDLGDAIDTTLGVYADPGLVLLNTTSFSGVASQSVNDVFSATYDNYQVVLTLSGVTADASTYFRLRVSGADATGTNYNFIIPSVNTSNASSPGNNANSNEGIFLFRTDGGSSNSSYLTSVIISNPFLSEFTSFSGTGVGRDSAGLTQGASISGTHTLATSYTGLTYYTGSGNVTGKISIYGLSK